MTDKKDDRGPPPPLVQEGFSLLAQAEAFQLVSYKPVGSENVYWLIGAVSNGDIVPFAMIPANGEWLKMVDALIRQHGLTPQLDPQFTGTIQ